MKIDFAFDSIVDGVPKNNIFEAPSYYNLFPAMEKIPYSPEWGTVVQMHLRFLSAKEVKSNHTINYITVEEVYDSQADLILYPIVVYRNALQYPWPVNHLARRIVDYVNQDKIKVLILNSFEVVRENYDMSLYKNFLREICNDQRITDLKNIVTACSDCFLLDKWEKSKLTPEFKCIDLNGWMPATKNLIEKHHPNLLEKNYIESYKFQPVKKSTFLLMINRPTKERFLLYKILQYYNLLSYGLVSINQEDRFDNYSQIIKDEKFLDFVKVNPNIEVNKFANDVQWDVATNAGVFVHEDWISQSYFSVVIETRTNEISSQITEKVYKLFYYGHPFIVYGSKGILKKLHSLGYQTYSELFDESYDNMIASEDKLKFIAEQIKYYTTEKGRQKLLELWPTIIEKLEYNRNLFLSMDQNDVWAQIKDL